MGGFLLNYLTTLLPTGIISRLGEESNSFIENIYLEWKSCELRSNTASFAAVGGCNPWWVKYI